MEWFAGCRCFIETLELSGKFPLSFSTLDVLICDNGLGGIWPGEMMRTLMMSLLVILHLLGCVSYCLGHPLLHIYLSPLGQRTLTARDMIIHARSITTSVLFFQSNSHQKHTVNPSTRSIISPTSAPLPSHSAFNAGPSSSLSPRHHGRRRHRHHHLKPPAVDVTPSDPACDQTCVDPLTATPFGSTCGCVFPMKVRLLLTVAPLDVFPVINELEIEVATATYLEQSQVKIMGATADSQNQGRTVVDINLVPLGEKFDNTTAALTYERFLHKKVVLNVTLFGNYEVIYISYPGIPTSPPQGTDTASGPRGSAGDLPISANFVNKSPGLNVRTIAIIGLSAFVIILVFIGAVSFLIKRRKFGRPSSSVGPTLASSLNKRSRAGSIFSSNISSSPSVSLISSMPTCVLSVRTFSLSELEKATEKFSSKRILGEGGFGCVYCATMEDGTEAAVKLLTRDKQNQDREFIAEVEMLSRLHHRNLVKLIGICIEGWTRCLVYEIVHNGSVESHLHGADKIKGPLTWDARMKIALGAARGLAYLHEDSNPRVIHRDFKASNVLLEVDFTPKVADFGLAREATEGSEHISTRVMGTFGYVAPEYAMTGHLLVKSDVYSYGVVLLELLSGRKPVDMSQPSGQENLVTWARPLLTSREGLEQLVDPSLAGTYDFDDMAKVAAIASMCVQPEVTHRPFMGEVVQALKLIYNDTDETGGDCASQKESSIPDSDFKGDFPPSGSGWWKTTGGTGDDPFPYGQTSSFMTMDYSSGPLDDTDNRPFSTTRFARDENRSGPLRIIRSKPNYRLRGSMSEHGGLLPRHIWGDSYWV